VDTITFGVFLELLVGAAWGAICFLLCYIPINFLVLAITQKMDKTKKLVNWFFVLGFVVNVTSAVWILDSSKLGANNESLWLASSLFGALLIMTVTYRELITTLLNRTIQ
jgi:hypothetical protein